MSNVSIDPKSKTVVLGDFRTKALAVYETPVGVAASFELANGIVMLAGLGTNVTGSVWLEAWRGRPGTSDGVAIEGSNEPFSWRNIPLCECGIRECGNINRQYSQNTESLLLLPLLTAISMLDHKGEIASDSEIWPPGYRIGTDEAELNRAVIRWLRLQ